MKVVTLSWSFMTNTLKFPVVKAGRIVSMTSYEKGEGRWSGRFPTVYAVVTDDFETEQAYCRRGDSTAEEQHGSLRYMDGLHPILFRTPDFAEKVAIKWSNRGK